MNRLDEILCSPADEDRAFEKPDGAIQGRTVEVRDLRFAYPGTGREVLQGLSFKLERGKITAVIGRVGCGKSTLAALISRLYEPPAASIFMDGVDILEIPRHRLRGLVGAVPQESFLFGMSIEENIAFGIPGNADPARIREVLETAGMTQEIDALPQGVRSVLGERGVNLSGGQRQRLAIARALAMDPPVLILDDCLSSVDVHTERRILASIRGALVGRATLLITHRLAAARLADHILVLDEGRVIEEGTHEQLLAAKGTYAELCRWQALSEELEEVA